MNKAFVKEPEPSADAYCPTCGALGVAVGSETLAAMVREEFRGSIGTPAFFCGHPTCDTDYFDLFDRHVPVAALERAVYPKDLAAPICPCFGLTCDDIEADLDEGGVRRVRSVVERAKSPEAHCLASSPTGRPCVAEVQRYYMRRRAERTSAHGSG